MDIGVEAAMGMTTKPDARITMAATPKLERGVKVQATTRCAKRLRGAGSLLGVGSESMTTMRRDAGDMTTVTNEVLIPFWMRAQQPTERGDDLNPT